MFLRGMYQCYFSVTALFENVRVAAGINKITFLAFTKQSVNIQTAYCTERRTSLTVWQNSLEKYR